MLHQIERDDWFGTPREIFRRSHDQGTDGSGDRNGHHIGRHRFGKSYPGIEAFTNNIHERILRHDFKLDLRIAAAVFE